MVDAVNGTFWLTDQGSTKLAVSRNSLSFSLSLAVAVKPSSVYTWRIKRRLSVVVVVVSK